MLRYTYTASRSTVFFSVPIKFTRIPRYLTLCKPSKHVAMFTSQFQYPRVRTASTIWVGDCVWPRDRVDVGMKGWRTSTLLPKLYIYIYILNIAGLTLNMFLHRHKTLIGGSFPTKFRHYWFCTKNVSCSKYTSSHSSPGFTRVP
jgi:hypothetical protein